MMGKVLTLLLTATVLLTPVSAGARTAAEVPAGTAAEAAVVAATGVMEAFLEAFNARDEAAWAETLLFPHVRLASQRVAVYPDAASFIAAMDLDAFARTTGWSYSTWDDMQVVQASPDKVHIQVIFSRFDADDELLASFQSLYVIEQVDGRWGVRARSSFAP